MGERKTCDDCKGARPCLKCAPSGWYPAPSGCRSLVIEAALNRLKEATDVR